MLLIRLLELVLLLIRLLELALLLNRLLELVLLLIRLLELVLLENLVMVLIQKFQMEGEGFDRANKSINQTPIFEG